MRCYFVARITINDRDTYQEYLDGFDEIFTNYKGMVLAVDEEPEVLEGASSLLAAARIRKIAIDAGPERHGLPTVEATRQSLASYGYEVFERDFIVFGINRAVLASG